MMPHRLLPVSVALRIHFAPKRQPPRPYKPVAYAQAVLAALQRAGFDVVRVRGSHYQLLNPIRSLG
jgi:hypothetical protein